MTLVVVAENALGVFALSDVMTSAKTEGNGVIEVPSLFMAPGRYDHGPVKFYGAIKQKIVALGDNRFLGWAGHSRTAKLLCDALLAEPALPKITHERWVALIGNARRQTGKPISCILMLGSDAAQPLHFGGTVKSLRRSETTFHVIGLGTDEFVAQLDHYLKYGGSIDGAQAAYFLGKFGVQALVGQRHGSLGISTKWGGAFELVVTVDDGTLTKVPNVLWLTGEVKRRADGLVSLAQAGWMLTLYEGDDCIFLYRSPRGAMKVFQAPHPASSGERRTTFSGRAQLGFTCFIDMARAVAGSQPTLSVPILDFSGFPGACVFECSPKAWRLDTDPLFWEQVVSDVCRAMGYADDEIDVLQRRAPIT